ncbi:MAG: amino acid adenylation domain-containing protein [Pseudomonadales bacterium]
MNASSTGVQNLAGGFFSSAARHPDRPALSLGEHQWNYAALSARALLLGGALLEDRIPDEPDFTGIFGHRSVAAFSGILGSLAIGRAYVPLNTHFPVERSRRMIEKAGLVRIVAEADSLPALMEVVADIERPLWILVPDADEGVDRVSRAGQHTFVYGVDAATELATPLESVNVDALAYLLFTSGSTGDPKGVMVMHRNVRHFLDVMVDRYDIRPSDRLSQTFDLTFDLSVFDMFVAWERGACVCVPSRAQKMLPAKYVASQELTVWFSVPSTAIMMRKLRMLKPDQYPSLRWSLFCGEALPIEVAEAFQQAAPRSVVENLYGPTELTIACSYYRYDSDRCTADAKLDVVPIGEPYPGMTELIADESLQPVEPGEAGELLMTGPQVARGYWQDAEKTSAAFVVPPGHSEVYYRTGDRVKRESSAGPMLYLGRMDGQIKIQGYRVELGEIEAVLRKAAGVDTAIALGYPEGINGADGVIAFIAESTVNEQSVRDVVQQHLPSYMQPTEYHWLPSFPLNANGKVDRGALRLIRNGSA